MRATHRVIGLLPQVLKLAGRTPQAGRINYLRRQLGAVRRGLAGMEAAQQDDGVVRSMARKEYQLSNQLGL